MIRIRSPNVLRYLVMLIVNANNYHLEGLKQLKSMLNDYVNWFNIIRIYWVPRYLSPT